MKAARLQGVVKVAGCSEEGCEVAGCFEGSEVAGCCEGCRVLLRLQSVLKAAGCSEGCRVF